MGALVAFPALRLQGIYLALANAAFAMFCSSMVFNQTGVMPGGNRQVPRLDFRIWGIDSDYGQLGFFAVLFAVIGTLLIVLRRSSGGRRLTALKDSPIACATLGLNLTATKVGVFALSAAIAGAAGATSGRTFLAETLSLPSSLSITMIAVVGGIGSVAERVLRWSAAGRVADLLDPVRRQRHRPVRLRVVVGQGLPGVHAGHDEHQPGP
ncbi:MAG: hypothetical protein IPG46_20435 [Actinobacteria bacterium]|nr:hypothetical protein [Actinomycetota bacterium]